MKLNVQSMSAAERDVISSAAIRRKVDAICLQETDVAADKACYFSISSFDLLNFYLHANHSCTTYIHTNLLACTTLNSHPFSDTIEVGVSISLMFKTTNQDLVSCYPSSLSNSSSSIHRCSAAQAVILFL